MSISYAFLSHAFLLFFNSFAFLMSIYLTLPQNSTQTGSLVNLRFCVFMPPRSLYKFQVARISLEIVITIFGVPFKSCFC